MACRGGAGRQRAEAALQALDSGDVEAVIFFCATFKKFELLWFKGHNRSNLPLRCICKLS